MSRDYVALARGYEADVLSGAVPVCRWVRLAVERNRRDLDRAAHRDPAFPYVFDAGAATRICLAVESLPHIKGPKAKMVGRDDAGRPVWATIVLEPWQAWFLTTLFGWLCVDSGLRRFRVGLLMVPRKNAKSTLAAAIVLYMLTSDGESGAECYSAATMKDQAKVVAEIAWEMAKRSPAFCEYFGVRIGSKTTRTLEVPATASRFGPLSADAHTLDALNVSLAVVDELHAHKTRDVWDVLDTATGARPQPLMLPTTTAGVDTGGICFEKLTYLQKILERVADDEAFFGVYYTIDEGDDYRDPEVLRKANPNYGVSVSAADLARKVREAQHSPAAINNFLTKHCDVWVRAAASWMPMDAWHACADPGLTLEQVAGYPCWIGVDLAEVRDMAALAAVFRLSDDRIAVFCRYYLPQAAIDQSPVAQYPGWVHGGHIIATPGNQADYQRIEDDLVAWCARFPRVQEIDFDRALAAQMAQNLKRRFEATLGRDKTEAFVVTVPQTVQTMNPAMQMTERLVLKGALVHDGNPVLAWNFSNIVVERNHKDEVYPRKAGGKDSPHKIDGATAYFTALSRLMTHEAPKVSVYATRGAYVIPAAP